MNLIPILFSRSIILRCSVRVESRGVGLVLLIWQELQSQSPVSQLSSALLVCLVLELNCLAEAGLQFMRTLKVHRPCLVVGCVQGFLTCV